MGSTPPQFEVIWLLNNRLVAVGAAESQVIDFSKYERIESVWVRARSTSGGVQYSVFANPGITSVGQFNNPAISLSDENRFLETSDLIDDHILLLQSESENWQRLTPNFAPRSPYLKFQVTNAVGSDTRIDLIGYFKIR